MRFDTPGPTASFPPRIPVPVKSSVRVIPFVVGDMAEQFVVIATMLHLSDHGQSKTQPPTIQEKQKWPLCGSLWHKTPAILSVRRVPARRLRS